MIDLVTQDQKLYSVTNCILKNPHKTKYVVSLGLHKGQYRPGIFGIPWSPMSRNDIAASKKAGRIIMSRP